MTTDDLRDKLLEARNRYQMLLANPKSEKQKERLERGIADVERHLQTIDYIETHTIRSDAIPPAVLELKALYPELELYFASIIRTR